MRNFMGAENHVIKELLIELSVKFKRITSYCFSETVKHTCNRNYISLVACERHARLIISKCRFYGYTARLM